MVTWDTFETAHLASERRLRTYLARGRKGSIRLERAVLDELDPHAAHYLHANNAHARIAFAAVAKRHMAKLIRTHQGPFFWVTLIVKQFVVPEDVAGAFSVRKIQAWTHQVLRGLSYVGMVEAALYTNVGPMLGNHQCVVSWHVHLIVWGGDEAMVEQIMNNINTKYNAFLPGVVPAYAVPVTGDEVIEKTL